MPAKAKALSGTSVEEAAKALDRAVYTFHSVSSAASV